MTSNQASVIDEGEFTVRRTIRIAAPDREGVVRGHRARAHLALVRAGRARRRRRRRARHPHVPRLRRRAAADRGDRRAADGLVPLGQRRRQRLAARRGRRRALDGLHLHPRAGRRTAPSSPSSRPGSRPPPTRPRTSRATARAGTASSTSSSPCSRAARDDGDAGPGVRRARRRDPVEHPGGTRRGRRLGVRPRRAPARSPARRSRSTSPCCRRSASSSRSGSAARCSTA